MAVDHQQLGRLLRRPPRYGINASAVPLAPGVPTYIRITDIDDSGRFSPHPKVGVAHPDAPQYHLSSGELVFARTGASVGKSYLYNPKDGVLVFAGFLINVAPDLEQLDPKYLSLFAQTKEYWDWIARTSVRSGQPGVNGREYAQLPVPLPPIEVQRAISDALQSVDDMLVVLESMIAKKLAIKQGMMQRLLTGTSRLPGFAGPWIEVRAGEIGSFKGGSGFPLRFQGARAGRIPFFKVSDMNHEGNELFMRKSRNYVSEKQRAQMGAVLMPSGAIVFAKVGAAVFLERKRILDRPSCIDNNMAAFVLDQAKADTRFIHYILLNFPLASLVATTAMPSVNGGQLRTIPIVLPESLDEQRAIALVLDDVDREIVALSARLNKARAIKQGMLEQLLAGKRSLPIEVAS